MTKTTNAEWIGAVIRGVISGAPMAGGFHDERIRRAAEAIVAKLDGTMTREELGNNISAYIAGATMGCSNIEITSAIMKDVDLYAPRQDIEILLAGVRRAAESTSDPVTKNHLRDIMRFSADVSTQTERGA